MKYNAGDKVTIKSREWYEKNKDRYGDVSCGKTLFMELMAEYAGLSSVVTQVSSYSYSLDIDGERWCWTDEMFEDNDSQAKSSLDTLTQLRSDREQLEKKISELLGDFIEKYKGVVSEIEIRQIGTEFKINVTL